ncbi:MAG TPA: hypothetical protein VHB18_00230 [Mycobacteriales bacterium]|nr:hypothetical protein [Mycobacteriales bacterium]
MFGGRQPSGRLLCGHRFGEQVALDQGAAKVAQLGELPGALHAFGDRRDLQRLGEHHDGGHDRVVDDARVDVANEASVDLHDVDREALQVVQRGMAGPEVVDRHPHADLLETVQRVDRPLDVTHREGLGDLQAQPISGKAGVVEGATYRLDEVAVLELTCGEVDADADAHAVIGLPGPALPARLAKDVAAEREDQPGLLGERDEVRRGDDAPYRVLPTYECLGIRGATGHGVDERLEVHLDCAFDDGQAKVRLEVELLHRAGGAAGVLVPPAQSLGLGVVHGEVGVVEEVVTGRARSGHGQPDRQACHDRPTRSHRDRLRHRRHDAVGDAVRLVQPVDVLEQDGELVAAEARDGVSFADQAGEPRGDLPEQPVAGMVPEAVVDDLEPVDIGEDDGAEAPVASAAKQRLVQPVDEQPAVGQPGELVVEGVVCQLRLVADPLRVVPERQHHAVHAVGTVRRGTGEADRQSRAVGTNQRHRGAEWRSGEQAAAYRGEQLIDERTARSQVGCGSQQRSGRAVPEGGLLVEIEGAHPLGEAVEDGRHLATLLHDFGEQRCVGQRPARNGGEC